MKINAEDMVQPLYTAFSHAIRPTVIAAGIAPDIAESNTEGVLWSNICQPV